MDRFAHFPTSDVDGVFLVDVRAIVSYICFVLFIHFYVMAYFIV